MSQHRDFQTFVSHRVMQLKTGPMCSAYMDWLDDHRLPLRLIVSNTPKGLCRGVAERVARRLGGRYCYDWNHFNHQQCEGIVLLTTTAFLLYRNGTRQLKK